jgi:2-methylcitrate dehydratase PrpD
MKTERHIENVLDFASRTQWRDVPEETRRHVKSLILDSLTVLPAGYRAVGCREILDILGQWPAERGASVLFSNLMLDPPTAAMANATLAEAWDFDDTHDAAIVHCMSPVLYAALAAAEWSKEKVDGSGFLAGVAIGLEVVARLGMACTSPLTWTRTATLGGMAGALTAARLSNVNRETMLNAAGIAYMQAAGNSQTIVDAATAKKLQVGFAARAAVLGTLLAKKGLTGPKDILEGKYGYYELYERGKHTLSSALEGLGYNWEIDNISVKPFPCARECHAAIFAAFEASQGKKIALPEIERVVVSGPGILRDISGKGTASAGAAAVVSAHLSIPYTVAVVLLEGEITLMDFTEAKILQPERQRLASSIEVKADTALPFNDLAPAEVTIILRQGSMLSGSCRRLAKGFDSVRDPSVIERKRLSCVGMSEHPRTSEYLQGAKELLVDAEAEADFAKAMVERLTPGDFSDLAFIAD